MTSPAPEIEQLADYISSAAKVDQEKVSDLLWALYSKAADNAVERIIARQKKGI